MSQRTSRICWNYCRHNVLWEIKNYLNGGVRNEGTKNTLGDLNNHLFAQLEKMDDDELTGEQLDNEIRRTEAMAKISEQIIKNGELQFRAMKHMDEYGYERQKAIPDMLEVRGGA